MKKTDTTSDLSLPNKILDILIYLMEGYISIIISQYFNNILFGILSFLSLMFISCFIMVSNVNDITSLLTNKDKLQEVVNDNLWKAGAFNLAIIVFLKFGVGI